MVSFISAIESCASHADAMTCANQFKIPDLSIDGNASDATIEESAFQSPPGKAVKRPHSAASEDQSASVEILSTRMGVRQWTHEDFHSSEDAARRSCR